MNLRATEEQTCRLCTNQGANYTPIFKKNEGDVVRMIRCLPVQIRSNDGLPSHICPGCLQALDVSYNLHILCLKANLKLLERSTSLRTKNVVEKGRTRVERREKVETQLRKEKEKKKTSEDDSDSGRDPIILESFHFPEAVYNNHQEFSKIFQKAPAVKLERVVDSASTNDVNHNQVFENVQCKLEPIDIDEPGPSGQQPRAAPSPENIEIRGEKSNVKDENESWRAGSPVGQFRDPQRTCQECGEISSISNFRLKRVKNNQRRVRADACKICEQKNPPVDKRRSRTKNNQPCISIENMQKAENNEPEMIDAKDSKEFINMHIPDEHSYARFARSCALKTIWKQQLASTKSSPKPKTPRQKRSSIKVDHSCVICGQKHSRASKLKHHIAVHHTPPEEWEYSCNRCGDRFPLITDFKRHEMWDHKVERKFFCDLCPASFLTSHGLTLHKTHRHRVIKKENTNDDP